MNWVEQGKGENVDVAHHTGISANALTYCNLTHSLHTLAVARYLHPEQLHPLRISLWV
jgi:hypothetical protein